MKPSERSVFLRVLRLRVRRLRANAYNNKERLRRKLAGLCIHYGCPSPAQETNLMCAVHQKIAQDAWYAFRKRHLDERHERDRRYSVKRRKQLKRAGRCQRCGHKGLVSKTMCEKCYLKHRKKHRKKNVKMLKVCSFCRTPTNPTHNRTTCPERKDRGNLNKKQRAILRAPREPMKDTVKTETSEFLRRDATIIGGH